LVLISKKWRGGKEAERRRKGGGKEAAAEAEFSENVQNPAFNL
jgi:hypothetical protein